MFKNSIESFRKFTEDLQKVGGVHSAKSDILGIQPKAVNCADAKVLAPKIMNAIVKLDNANARKIMMDINATSVRYV